MLMDINLIKLNLNVTMFRFYRIITITNNTIAMNIDEYKINDKVEVLINNPRNNNLDEWRKGEVISKRMIYPEYGSHHKPYPILIVRTIRTYCKATPNYRLIDNNISVYVDSTLEFYDKEDTTMIIYNNQIKLQ